MDFDFDKYIIYYICQKIIYKNNTGILHDHTENMQYAHLINYSQPGLSDTKQQSLTDMIAYCARVSNPSNQNNMETNERLLNYLITHQHWSPFEMVSICIEIQTTRDIARQILRHRSFSFQEFSQRYAIADLGSVVRETRLQDTQNRQNSIEIDVDSNETFAELAHNWEVKQDTLNGLATETYQWAIDHGIAKEQARTVLPEGLTLSRLYMNGTLRSWIHYIQLRTMKETQKEHREIARLSAIAISEVFPMIMKFVSE